MDSTASDVTRRNTVLTVSWDSKSPDIRANTTANSSASGKFESRTVTS
jgi:hypothetical protein